MTAMMIGFPLLMYYMWIGATFYDGHFPTPAVGEGMGAFFQRLGGLVAEHAFPSAKAWAIYWTFFVVEGAFYCLMPGIYANGKPLPHLGGQQLAYYCSAYASFYTTLAIAAVLHITGLFPLYVFLDEYGPIMSVAIISGFLVSIIAYVSAFVRGETHRMTGSHLYDFFMGAELNPRMFGVLDFKMFFEVRIPWYILFLTSAAATARQYEKYGAVSGEVLFVLMAHYLYANACSKAEDLIVTTWDMYFEKWGFMLIFWNLAGVPFTYGHCTLYIANHDPAEYQKPTWVLALMFTSYLFVYWVWDTCNSQKNIYRQRERGVKEMRKTFPQLPYRAVDNPVVIKTEDGRSLLCDGWCKWNSVIYGTETNEWTRWQSAKGSLPLRCFLRRLLGSCLWVQESIPLVLSHLLCMHGNSSSSPRYCQMSREVWPGLGGVHQSCSLSVHTRKS